MIEIYMKNHLVSDKILQYCKSTMPNLFFYNGWQIMLGLHWVLVTLHGWSTIGIEKEKKELVTLNTMFNILKMQESMI